MATDYPRIQKLLPIIGLIVILFIAAWSVPWGNLFWHGNYAEEVARPLEEGLIKLGAVKKCSYGDAGRSADNDKPWYGAILEMPGSQDQVANAVKDTASTKGFHLIDASQEVNAEDRIYLGDNTSKKSPYDSLNNGPIDLHATIHRSQVYEENSSFCGVKKQESASREKTTIDINVSLPEYRK